MRQKLPSAMMHSISSTQHRRCSGGFTLPVILILVAGLLILTVGVLWIVGLENQTTRAFIERQRAELAAKACLETVSALLKQELNNDDFLIIQGTLDEPTNTSHERSPYLFVAKGMIEEKQLKFSYTPLFSIPIDGASLPKTDSLKIPEPKEWPRAEIDQDRVKFSTVPFRDSVAVTWIPIKDVQGRIVSRFAYWVEDLQAKLDPLSVGNLTGEKPPLKHVREPYPFPAPGLNPLPEAEKEAQKEPPLNQVALYAIFPETTSTEQGEVGKSLIEHRSILVTPDSTVAAALPEIALPLVRDVATGHLVDPAAQVAEEDLVTQLQPYLERPMIPFITAIQPDQAGTPQKNLNALLAKAPATAVTEMADFITQALPDFESRKGGFPAPESYVKTLAANAIDYADIDSEPTVLAGSYRGIDAAPLLSESSLQINYLGMVVHSGRNVLKFNIKIFAELYNPTNQKIDAGEAQLSYEVGLFKDAIGAGVSDDPFDSPAMLNDSSKSTHLLKQNDGLYWTPALSVNLEANQYHAYQFAEVVYQLDAGPSSTKIAAKTPFSLSKSLAAGMSLKWNGQVIDRSHAIIRRGGLVSLVKVKGSGFKVGTPETITKACIPGLLHDDLAAGFLANPGDSRIAYYMKESPLAESAYPENCSPNRRNIRLDIYENDTVNKLKVHARVLPSEWPDGGHNSVVGSWDPGTSDKTLLSDEVKFGFPYEPKMAFSAPQWISNRGYFLSATELGHLFDPIMYEPKLATAAATNELLEKHKFSTADVSWPDVAVNNIPSNLYGGGNSLRIGRPEHPAFSQPEKPSMRATNLLDLFHAGLSRSTVEAKRQGPLIRIEGHVNLNTATHQTLRALAAGALVMDPLLAKQTSDVHLGAPSMAAPNELLKLSAPALAADADRIAAAVIRSRPYASRGSLALAKEEDGTAVFGNKNLYPDAGNIEWSDAAAEEIFARVYEASTVRSRNFRLWVVAQSVSPVFQPSPIEVLSEIRKVYKLFIDPGERGKEGEIVPEKLKTVITSSNDF
jgi:hypothetical protein